MDAGCWDRRRGKGTLLLLPGLPWGSGPSQLHPALWHAAGSGGCMGGAAGQGGCQLSSHVRGYHVGVRAFLVAQLVKNLPAMRETPV